MILYEQMPYQAGTTWSTLVTLSTTTPVRSCINLDMASIQPSGSSRTGNEGDMKILTAITPTSEVDVMRHIQRNGSEFTLRLIGEFERTGPNGVPHCIISDVLGSPLSSDIEELYPDEEYPVSHRYSEPNIVSDCPWPGISA
jgi:hypothetical protein